MALTVTGELMVGGWTKEANPRLTMSLVDGGKDGPPWTAAQLPAVSHAVLTAPIGAIDTDTLLRAMTGLDEYKEDADNTVPGVPEARA